MHTVCFLLTFHIIVKAHNYNLCILSTVVVISSSFHLLPFQPPTKYVISKSHHTTLKLLSLLPPLLPVLLYTAGSDSWSTWNCLQNCLKTGCRSFQEDSEAMEISFLKRCVSVVIQRLARSSEAWTADTLKGSCYAVL